jgi:hypothetical protein
MTRWIDRRVAIKNELQEIDDIVLWAKSAQDFEVRHYLSRLAVIRLSGYIETCVEHMTNGYLEENSSHRVLNFGQSQVSRVQNLNPAKLEALVGNFDPEWKQGLAKFLNEEERRQDLGNLIDARHKIAHGKSSSVVGPTLLDRYHRLAEDLVRLLSTMFLPVWPTQDSSTITQRGDSQPAP